MALTRIEVTSTREMPAAAHPGVLEGGEMKEDKIVVPREPGGSLLPRKTFRDGFRYRLMSIHPCVRDTPLKFKLGFALWGFDIFIWEVPVLKSLIAANVLVWMLLWWAV